MENPYAIDGIIYIKEIIISNKRKQEIPNIKTKSDKRSKHDKKTKLFTSSNIYNTCNTYKKQRIGQIDNLDFFDQMVIY